MVVKTEDREYTVEYPLSSVIKAEVAVGHSLKSLADWFDIKWEEVHLILHAGIVGSVAPPEEARGAVGVTVEEIRKLCEDLGAEGVLEIQHALTRLNFPRTLEKCEAQIRGQKSPN